LSVVEAGPERGLGGLRAVIAHDNLWWYGGAERIVATAAAALPEAPFYAILGREEVARRMGIADRYRPLLPEREVLLRRYRELAPLYPALIRARPLPEADVLLTSSFAFAHHFRTRNRAPQLCYCYSPLRLAWSMTDGYGRDFGGGPAGAAAVKALAAWLRRVDRKAASRVTRYVAESRYVADQIARFYDREADVIYPPVDTELFRPGSESHEDYYLFCGRLVEAYKRPSLAVDAFTQMPDRRLVVAGDGPARAELEARAGPNVEFVGHLGDEELVAAMQRCAAAVFPSRDDFGLIPVEVAACGRPAIAFAAGGALETVAPGVSGEFFPEQTVASLREAVEAFDPAAYDPAAMRAHAEQWGRERFQRELLDAVGRTAAG
jgi:glycosyltransferase involved in cell wall biosynthesis